MRGEPTSHDKSGALPPWQSHRRGRRIQGKGASRSLSCVEVVADLCLSLSHGEGSRVSLPVAQVLLLHFSSPCWEMRDEMRDEHCEAALLSPKGRDRDEEGKFSCPAGHPPMTRNKQTHERHTFCSMTWASLMLTRPVPRSARRQVRPAPAGSKMGESARPPLHPRVTRQIRSGCSGTRTRLKRPRRRARASGLGPRTAPVWVLQPRGPSPSQRERERCAANCRICSWFCCCCSFVCSKGSRASKAGGL